MSAPMERSFPTGVLVAAFEEAGAADEAGAWGDECGHDVGETGTQVGDLQICGGERGGSADDGGVLEVPGGEAAVPATDAGGGQGDGGAHGVELPGVPESILVDRLVDDRCARGLGEQHDEGLLPVGHVAGVHPGLHVFAVLAETGEVPCWIYHVGLLACPWHDGKAQGIVETAGRNPSSAPARCSSHRRCTTRPAPTAGARTPSNRSPTSSASPAPPSTAISQPAAAAPDQSGRGRPGHGLSGIVPPMSD